MKSSCQILPGIKKIGWTYCKSLPTQISLSGISRLSIAILSEINYITFFGSPECSCSTVKEKNGWMQEASLKFISSEALPFESRLAFIVNDVNDNWFLIGNNEGPFPKIKIEKVTGSPGERAGVKYEITHKDIRTLLPCLI